MTGSCATLADVTDHGRSIPPEPPARHPGDASPTAQRAAGVPDPLEPALTAVMAIVLLSERLTVAQWLGAGLILAAVLLAQSDAEPLRAAPPRPESAEA